MPKCIAIMLNYAQVRWESYYAQIYASIMCQGLVMAFARMTKARCLGCFNGRSALDHKMFTTSLVAAVHKVKGYYESM